MHCALVQKLDHHESESAGKIIMLIKIKERQLLGCLMCVPVLWFFIEPLPAAFILAGKENRVAFLVLSCLTSVFMCIWYLLYLIGIFRHFFILALLLKLIVTMGFILITAIKIYMLPFEAGWSIAIFVNQIFYIMFLFGTEALSSWLMIRVKLKQGKVSSPNSPDKKESSLIVDMKWNSMRQGIASKKPSFLSPSKIELDKIKDFLKIRILYLLVAD